MLRLVPLLLRSKAFIPSRDTLVPGGSAGVGCSRPYTGTSLPSSLTHPQELTQEGLAILSRRLRRRGYNTLIKHPSFSAALVPLEVIRSALSDMTYTGSWRVWVAMQWAGGCWVGIHTAKECTWSILLVPLRRFQ